jgi:hypothetical protein
MIALFQLGGLCLHWNAVAQLESRKEKLLRLRPQSFSTPGAFLDWRNTREWAMVAAPFQQRDFQQSDIVPPLFHATVTRSARFHMPSDKRIRKSSHGKEFEIVITDPARFVATRLRRICRPFELHMNHKKRHGRVSFLRIREIYKVLTARKHSLRFAV